LFYDVQTPDAKKSPNHNSTFLPVRHEDTLIETLLEPWNRDEMSKSMSKSLKNSANASAVLVQAESTDTNRSSSCEEVDPKSNLANKTVFKSDNPNLSIVEINDNSIKEENSVIVVENISNVEGSPKVTPKTNRENLETQSKEKTDKTEEYSTLENQLLAATSEKTSKSNSNSIEKTVEGEGDERSNKRVKKPLVHSSKQKLDVAVAEAFAAGEDANNTTASLENPQELLQNLNDLPKTKRDIKIYNTIEEFERNLPSTVTVLDTPFGSRVYLVGTAHFSEESQDDVSFVSTNLKTLNNYFQSFFNVYFRLSVMSVQMLLWWNCVHQEFTF